MELITENTTEDRDHKKRTSGNNLSLKILLIGLMMVVLLIPGGLILSLINERAQMLDSAQEDVARMWSGQQHITGPIVTIPYLSTMKDTDGNVVVAERQLHLLPDDLRIDGKVKCQQLRRGLYDTNVYNAELSLEGTFEIPAELNTQSDAQIQLKPEQAILTVGIADLRGIEESIEIVWNDRSYPTRTITDNGCFDVGVGAQIDLSEWLKTAQEEARLAIKATPAQSRFALKMKLKGSSALYMAPVGNQNTFRLRSDCPTPSFIGNFLPSSREVTQTGFEAEWKVVAQNRSYPQILRNENSQHVIAESELGVNLLIPVTQYQQTTRAIKYAALIILLTFIGVFFVEMSQHKHIHIFQYLLVGLGLVLFYSLLVSISEHLDFMVAYLISAVMTVALISAYLYGVTRRRSTSLGIGGILTLLYTYVYILLQLESYALLTGSIGLFVILAVIMHYSLKMKWTSVSE